MTVHAPATMTKEAFLDWVGQREERCEFSGGRVTMMVRVTRNHSRVTKNLLVALSTRLSSASYDVAAESFAVHIDDSEVHVGCNGPNSSNLVEPLAPFSPTNRTRLCT